MFNYAVRTLMRLLQRLTHDLPWQIHARFRTVYWKWNMTVVSGVSSASFVLSACAVWIYLRWSRRAFQSQWKILRVVWEMYHTPFRPRLFLCLLYNYSSNRALLLGVLQSNFCSRDIWLLLSGTYAISLLIHWMQGDTQLCGYDCIQLALRVYWKVGIQTVSRGPSWLSTERRISRSMWHRILW